MLQQKSAQIRLKKTREEANVVKLRSLSEYMTTGEVSRETLLELRDLDNAMINLKKEAEG